MKNRIVVAVPAGHHVLCLRLISGTGGWGFILDVAGWHAGLDDMMKTDREAGWRDYTRSLVRYENRPAPDGQCGGIPIEQCALLMANMGVDARWISVMNHAALLYDSAYLPKWKDAKPEHEVQLKRWVQLLHDRRISVMSWMDFSINDPAWEKHPDWRHQYLVPPPADSALSHGACCINSPYGEALIQCSIEALKKFDFDGLWFDGAFFSPIWCTTQPVSCVCPHCGRKFKAETGLELPERYDWSLPMFPQWVQWRYAMFSAYWQRLVDAVHAEVPQASIVFNHYHREGVSWNGAIPLNPFGHDFVSGTEADGEALKGAFYTRCMRAYDRPHTEVWMGLGGAAKKTIRGTICHPRQIMNFALSCATAGGHASVGGGSPAVESLVLSQMADELKRRAPYLELPTVPYAALHISQQTDTFVFGRHPRYTTFGKIDLYWNSLTGWHHLLAHAGLTLDVVYDDHLNNARRIGKYPVLIMPLAPAFNETQYQAVMQYVRQGGILITGPWFGVCNAWGEPRANPLGDRALFPHGQRFPSWEAVDQRPTITFQGPRGRETIKSRPLSALPADMTSVPLSFDKKSPLLVDQRVGKGRVIQVAVDLGTLFRLSPEKEVVDAVRPWMTKLVSPLVEVLDYDGLILGVFEKKHEVVVQIQQFTPPWKPEATETPRPVMRWNSRLIWHGARPKRVRCCLPQVGPELPVRKKGTGWEIELPAFEWGQIVAIQR